MARKSVNLRELRPAGSYLALEEKLALELATEYQRQEDPDYVSVSWACQERAEAYFNAHGFEETLGHMLGLRAKNDR